MTLKLFWEDRNSRTHPPDPRDPNKFKKRRRGVFNALDRNQNIESIKVLY